MREDHNDLRDTRVQENFREGELPQDVIDNLTEAQYGEDPDMVNHPPHYTSHPSGIECIDITRHMGFNIGNAMKYLWRADLKWDAIEDLEKAVFYINDEIKKRKQQKSLDNHSKI